MAEVRRGEEEDHTEIHHAINQATDHLDRNKADLFQHWRPEIISAEALDDDNWFSNAFSEFFSSPPQSIWSSGIQPPPSYDQVIQEKTREEHIVQPTAAPRRAFYCSAATCYTQTDPDKEKPAGKKPQKPPKPSLTGPESSWKSGPQKSQERRDSSDQCNRSVTVHWETTVQPDSTSFSVPSFEPRPVPRPRVKSRKQTEDNFQTLFKLEDDDLLTVARDSNRYLKQLLEVFSPNGDQENQEEQLHGEMNSHRNIQSKIQAFESQLAPEPASASEPIRPQPPPRKAVGPPVSAKPPLASQKPAGNPVREELETLLTKGGPGFRSRPPSLTRDYSIHDEEPPLPPRRPAEPTKEPLKANLNINNHNSAASDYAVTPANPAPIKARPSLTRRPTTIRVPSQISTESLQGNPPPLPVRTPVGDPPPLPVRVPVGNPPPLPGLAPVSPRNTAPVPKQKSLPSISTQGPLSVKRAPSLPNRHQSIKRTLPPRPPPAKPGPGRPPPPSVQAAKPSKGFLLPPRPVQGHRLYDKFTLPHTPDSTGEPSFQAAGPTGKKENGQIVQALHDFTPEGPGELGLKAGDIITMVERVNGEWCKGTCKGSTGYFPVNFVKVMSGAPPKPVPDKKPKPLSAKVSGPRCVARFDFAGESGEELSFAEGDVIQLQAYEGNEWARGQLGAASGIFPLNFVEVVEDLPPVPARQQSRATVKKVALPGMVSNQSEALKPAQSSVEWAQARHDFEGEAEDELSFKRGDSILVTKHIDDEWSCGRLNGKEGIFPKAFVESRTAGPTSPPEGVKGRAMYDFTSDCDEELSLQIGDIITNLESMDDEWFLGDLRGKRALVPKNYIQVL
ncbi:SH3 domain-containing protein 19 isoform X2 [Syngnathus scovelli]|uniref:SH3 domain-containing protein 19 isoform X2 n=1 Tax=Syngnathus scovelli TaxID=161590 RepID=UPI00210F681C|nr:SH3 domain-containing protein 19 isoform X2 [Syngnathus scovelli]